MNDGDFPTIILVLQSHFSTLKILSIRLLTDLCWLRCDCECYEAIFCTWGRIASSRVSFRLLIT